MIIFTINAIAYLIWAYFAYRRNKRITVYFMMVAVYALFAIGALPALISGVYFNDFGTFDLEILDPVPYILAFVVFYFAVDPLKYISDVKLTRYDVWTNTYIQYFIFIWVLLYIPFTVLKFSEFLITINSGLGEAYMDRHMDGEVLFKYSGLLATYNGRLTWIFPLTAPLVMFYTLGGLILRKVKLSYAVVLLVLSVLPPVLTSVSIGARGGLYMNMFSLAFFVVVFWKYFRKDIKKDITFFAFVAFLLVLYYSLDISISRSAISGGNAYDGILRYFGEPFPNLGLQIWDQVKWHPFGQRFFPDEQGLMSKGYIGADLAYYWGNLTGVKVWIFKTLYGDLYVEYGKVWGFVIPIVVSLLFKWYIKHRSLDFITIPVVYFYYQICVFSFDGYFYKGIGSTHRIMYLIIIVVLLNLVLKRENVSIRNKIMYLQRKGYGKS